MRMTEPAATPWFFHDSPLQLDDPQAPLPTASSSTVSTSKEDDKTEGQNVEEKDIIDDDGDNSNLNDEEDLPIPESLGGKVQEAQEKWKSSRYSTGKKNTQLPISRRSTPVFSTTSYMGSVTPNANWAAFNPSDNRNLETASDGAKDVPVGLHRLYAVSMEEYNIRPIYWSNSNQLSSVHRATWFYNTTLTPTEPSLEEELVKAFHQIKPWTEEYLAELQAASGVPEAIEKLKVPIEYSHHTDDKEKKVTKHKVVVVFPPCCKLPEPKDSAEGSTNSNDNVHPVEFPMAYLLPPATSSMMSILTAGPTPVQLSTALLSGKVPTGTLLTVQRHFDWNTWKSIHKLPDRPTDDPEFQPKKITQLVLVLHGIGQKLSDRVESFNFTYAINGFRISIEEQAARPGVAPLIADDGIMVLPVNWRRTLNFEDLKRNQDGNITSQQEEFTLQDITVRSIPAVRNIISDVMLDIPYYMSQHKYLILEAAVKEANRVYDLFCAYNPSFKEEGDTHIIGHSLGSVIALDVLSRQPTDYREQTDDKTPKLNFNTTNVFFAGSPCGFFLLLENSRLYPRQLNDNANKKLPMFGCLAVKNIYNIYHYSDPIAYALNPTVDPLYAAGIETVALPTERDFPVAGSENSGFFDSIASRFPKAPKFSAPSFWDSKSGDKSEGDGNKSDIDDHDSEGGGGGDDGDKQSDKDGDEKSEKGSIKEDASRTTEEHEKDKNIEGEKTKDQELISHSSGSTDSLDSSEEMGQLPSGMPSEVELETRDFDREYHAEEKIKLLNDNGQIDYMIPLAGTLENQYFSMLTAHSGYWDNKDFARLVAVECGRPRGAEHAVKQYKAKKKKSSLKKKKEER